MFHSSALSLRRSIALIFVVVAGLASASIARADGDPASDYLISNEVFLTSTSLTSSTPSPAQRELLATVRAANRAGFAIRVALISTDYDLGSITALWRKPGLYARFLGLELRSGYRGRLLVAMPSGFGFNWPAHPNASSDRLLARVPAGAGDDALALAAQSAVRQLATADGVKLAPVHAVPASSGHSGGADVAAIVGAALGGLAVIALTIVVVRALRRRRPRGEPARASETRLPATLRWAIPTVAVLVGVAVAVSVIALRGARPAVSAASVVTPPPFSWPAGERPAPDFVLHDQSGQPVSIRSYRGRPVIVTFIDPLCRNLCPLEAQVLNQMDHALPASARPAILAVSVDVYSNANSRKNLLQTFREWHLVPQWHWAIGSPRQLAAVWKRYAIGVSVVTKRIAGTVIHYITHTEAAYVVDATGHERALFVWPFYPQDVKRVVGRLA